MQKGTAFRQSLFVESSVRSLEAYAKLTKIDQCCSVRVESLANETDPPRPTVTGFSMSFML